MNGLKTAFLMALMTILFVFIGGLVGGRGGMYIAFAIALAMNFISYWFSDKIVLKMYNAKEVTEAEAPNLYNIVRRLVTRAELPMPKVYIIENPAPNAFATGRNPEHGVVAVTTGLLHILGHEEVEGVIAHELAHIKNRDILVGTIAAAMAGAIMMLADMARWSMIFGGNRDNDEEGNGGGIVGIIVAMVVAPLAATLIQMAISRSREYLADETGAKFCGKPLALADALKKISHGTQDMPMDANPATAHMFIMNPLSGKSFINLFSTHPPVEERVKRLEDMNYRRG